MSCSRCSAKCKPSYSTFLALANFAGFKGSMVQVHRRDCNLRLSWLCKATHSLGIHTYIIHIYIQYIIGELPRCRHSPRTSRNTVRRCPQSIHSSNSECFQPDFPQALPQSDAAFINQINHSIAFHRCSNLAQEPQPLSYPRQHEMAGLHLGAVRK